MIHVAYHTVMDSISEDKMQFMVTNHHPQYANTEAKTVRAEIMERLFEVFSASQNQIEFQSVR